MPSSHSRRLISAALLSLSWPAAAADLSVVVTNTEVALDAWRMPDVLKALPLLPKDALGAYIKGVVANRTNNTGRSTRLLQRALPELERTQPERAAKALLVLADDYRKASAYAAQEKVLRTLVEDHASHLTSGEMAGVRTDLQLAAALRDAPPQTIQARGPVTLPIQRNVVGTFNIDAVANGVTAPWMLDSGANFSIVTESFAGRLGLKIVGSLSGVGSITGIKSDTRIAVVKEIGLGAISLHDVVVLVVSDASLHVKLPKGEYQIDGVLGFPVFQALGKVTISNDTVFEADPGSIPISDGATMYLNELNPVVELLVNGQMLPFSLDTGASSSDLWHTYFERFGRKASAWRHGKRSTVGLGGAREFDIVLQPELRLTVGKEEVVLHDVPIEASNQRDKVAKRMFGNIGQDLWKNHSGFTIDFRSMRFRLENSLGRSDNGRD